jgi:mono/diheme cytochrome c family protein
MLVTAVAALVFGGCGEAHAPLPTSRTTTVNTAHHARLLATSKQVYAGHCSNCHRLLGKRTPTNPPPDAYGVSFDEIVVSESYVVERIANGFGGMQSFSGELTPAQIRAVAAYGTSVGGRDVHGGAVQPAHPAQDPRGGGIRLGDCGRT